MDRLAAAAVEGCPGCCAASRGGGNGARLRLAPLGREPILSYASYALWNWRRLDESGPIALGNIALLQHFLGGLDEAWFILIHVDIERRAGAALAMPTRADIAARFG